MGDHAYDLGMDNDRRGDAYMNGIAPATATCPWVPVMGNHEASDGDHYNRYLNQTWGVSGQDIPSPDPLPEPPTPRTPNPEPSAPRRRLPSPPPQPLTLPTSPPGRPLPLFIAGSLRQPQGRLHSRHRARAPIVQGNALRGLVARREPVGHFALLQRRHRAHTFCRA